MCGIVGLFLKDKSLEPKLGQMLTDMLITMTDRGPDSAGIAIYGDVDKGLAKITVQSADPTRDFADLDGDLHEALGQPVTILIKSSHAVIELPEGQVEAARTALARLRPNVKVMSVGDSLEIYKEVGLPKDVAARFHLHPSIRPDLDSYRGIVILDMPSGEPWVFRAAGGTIDLEDSVYFDPSQARPSVTKQVVVRARVVEYLGQITWSFGRVDEARPSAARPDEPAKADRDREPDP